jgi:hypothetical protein
MANEAYVAEQVAKAAQHPKALLLGAIGAMCPTPSGSANAAEKELGLTREEIQEARWVALFKRGKTQTEFFRGLLEIVEKERDRMIEVKKGGRHNLEILKSIIENVFRKASISIHEYVDDKITNEVVCLTINSDGKICQINGYEEEIGCETNLCDLRHWRPTQLLFHVFRRESLAKIKRAAAAFEKKTNIHISILQQY